MAERAADLRVLVMGASGRTGGAVVDALMKTLGEDADVRAALRSPDSYSGPARPARFDLLDPSTFDAALRGCDALFVMRPPPVTGAEAWPPLFEAARRAGVRRVVVSSVMGADRNRFLPHRHMEEAAKDAARQSGLSLSILRPSDYMQNLETVWREDVRDGLLRLPAGRGRSALIDVADIGACAAKLLQSGETVELALTGPEALSWHEVCAVLSRELPHAVRYRHIDPLRFWLRERARRGSMAAVMTALYTVQRLGLADEVTDGVERVLGHPPTPLQHYARREREAWVRGN